MNSQTTRTGLLSSIGLGWYAAIVFASAPTAQAQQRYYPQQPQGYPQQQGGYPQQYSQQQPPGYGYPQQQQPQTQYESPLQFLPKFGQRMSEMARRLFYGRNPVGYDTPPPAYGQNGGGYSLDSTPRPQAAPNYPQQSPESYPLPGSGYAPQQPGYQYPQQQPQQQPQSQPRYNYPPQQTAPQQTSPAPSSKSKTPAPPPQSKSSSSSSTRKYTPPRVNDSPPARTPSKPATVTPKKEVKPDAPPPTPAPTTRRSESTPKEFPSTTSSSGSSGSFLKGKRTAKPGRVISPYPPYKELDITGLESGSLALDPTTQKVFEVP
ncbi:hypothetical protein [Prosthecobacter sp.]|uniref:hypothetical protein n=1 Tax=Prosthecobacter sp. TaxID=1965333 RepID=UPI0024874B7C|nr:hypothetical protein [Prosthecobacter sp.]MDI1310717.1 hypothetical protein [Prosthecobacter sp.]